MFYKAHYHNFSEKFFKNIQLYCISCLLLVNNCVCVCLYVNSYNGSIIACKCVLLLGGQLERTLAMRAESLEVPIVTLSMLHYVKNLFQKVKHTGR